MDKSEKTIILKSTDDQRKQYEQLRSEAIKENIQQYINPQGIQVERTQLDPPILPAVDVNNLLLSQLLIQQYRINKVLYDNEMIKY